LSLTLLTRAAYGDTWDASRIALTTAAVSQMLKDSKPSIAMSPGEERPGLAMNSFMLQAGENRIVAEPIGAHLPRTLQQVRTRAHEKPRKLRRFLPSFHLDTGTARNGAEDSRQASGNHDRRPSAGSANSMDAATITEMTTKLLTTLRDEKVPAVDS